MNHKQSITDAVRAHYAAIANKRTSCCGPDTCCGNGAVTDMTTGYRPEELGKIPEGANLNLGCGNPTAVAELRPGDVVIDLGSGAGIDCFLAAERVGPEGRVIGIDMTEEMIAQARANAQRGDFQNVEFRHGQIEAMPVVSNTADVIISNCVINLAPDKEQVFREMFRVLKPGGRFIISDIVTRGQIPDAQRRDMEAWAGCIAGALPKEAYLAIVQAVGFTDLDIRAEVEYDYQKSADFALLSLTLAARKPAA